MIKSTPMTEEDKALMAKYNIQSETKTVFHSQGYKYDKLKDAVHYAEQMVERKQSTVDE